MGVMSGLFALLDDVAALVKLTASSLDDIAAGAGRASVKAAGVVVDDAAVTPRYVQGLKPERELSIIWRIAKGSLRNKLLIILPVALLLSQFAPFLLTPILMVGGTYLCYEGAEKLWEKFSGHEAKAQDPDEAAAADAAAHEKRVVSSATRTDFILSAEIMVIALNEVASEGLLARAHHPAGGGRADHGARLRRRRAHRQDGRRRSGARQASGPGRLRRSGAGWSRPCPSCCRPCPGSGWWRCCGSAVTSCWSVPTNSACTRPTTWSTTSRWPSTTPPAALGAVLGWLTNTFFSAVLGVMVGALVVTVLHLLPIGRRKAGTPRRPATPASRTGQRPTEPGAGSAPGPAERANLKSPAPVRHTSRVALWRGRAFARP